MTDTRPSDPWVLWILLGVAAIKFALHAAAAWFLPEPFSYFRDELYYLACAERLDFGYVDHPPLSVAILWGVRALAGDSLLAIRLTAALFGALALIVAGLITRELGGGRFAVLFTSLCVLLAPAFLGIHSFYSMNAIDHFIWAMSFYLIARILARPSIGLWIALGVVFGLGLQNKLSVLFLGFGFGVGLLATSARKLYLTPGPWVCGLIAGALFLPHVAWQIAYGWPTLEFMRNAAQFKHVHFTFLEFMREQLTIMHPVIFMLALLGLVCLFFAPSMRPYRAFGWLFLTVITVLIIQHGKPYYLVPAYFPLFASAAIAFERLTMGERAKLRIVCASLLILTGLPIAPIALPILPPEQYIAYSRALGIEISSSERHEQPDLPQFLADSIGWEAMVEQLAEVYHSLPDDERSRCALLVGNYGQAGAIDFWGAKHGLPKAICGHNNYHYWLPEEVDFSIVISLLSKNDLERAFHSLENAGVIQRPYSMPYEEGRPIWIGRDPMMTMTWQEARIALRHFD